MLTNLLLLLFLSAVPFQGSPQRIMCLHLTLSSSSSSLTPTNFMSSLTTSINLLFAWQLQPQHPSTDIFTVSPLNMSKPPQAGLSDFISKTSNLSCPSDVLIPDPVTPKENLNILSSATSSSASCLFFSATVSKPNNIAAYKSSYALCLAFATSTFTLRCIFLSGLPNKLWNYAMQTSAVVMGGNKTAHRVLQKCFGACSNGCVLSPILYTLFTYDCVASHKDNIILKFADDTAVIGRIAGGDEAAYRREVASLVSRCGDNNLTLNTDKTKETIVDMRKERRTHQQLFIRELEVEKVRSFKYLGVHITEDFTWTPNVTQLVKKAQQRLYFLRRLRKFGISPKILSNFYSCVIKSVLTNCITVWYGSTTAMDQTPAERGEDCTEDHQDSTALSAEHLPPQSPQESCFHPQRPLRPPARTVHTSTLRTEVQKCEMQDLETEELFLPLCHQTPKQLTGVCNHEHNIT
ncbi:hypothetical protein Q8A73_009511 [Channa argus]|nr:hypothetical protein Q8A73_009511 [Channa argus]